MRRTTILAVTCVLFAGACQSGGGKSFDSIAPTSESLSPLPTLPATSAEPTTSVAASATLPEGVVGLSADGPWKLVDSAPGITTPGLVYELMPGLWAYLPVVEDVANGITWTLNEDDRPIIEAYLQARLVFFQAVTSSPMDFSSDQWNEFYVDGGARLKSVFEPRGRAGEVVYLESGVVLRPMVGGDGRSETSALVLDCELDGSVGRTRDGSIAEGSTPGVTEDEVGATFQFVDGLWKLDRITTVTSACA